MNKYPSYPYAKWSKDPDGRWIDAGQTFGIHLMQNVRDDVLDRIPAGASPVERHLAEQMVNHTLYAMMQFLDGGFPTPIDKQHRVEYVLLARIQDRDDEVLETFELAPGGDGLCLGFQGWRNGDFGQKRWERLHSKKK